MMIAYWISMYLVVFAVVFSVLGAIFDKKGWNSTNAETTRLLLSALWIFWLKAVLIAAVVYFAFKIVMMIKKASTAATANQPV